MPSVLSQGFDEVVVCGAYKSGEGYRHLPVPRITGTTNDALIKRDVGTMATTSDYLVFLCDDHRLSPNFCNALKDIPLGRRNIGVPSRVARNGEDMIGLNTGFKDAYCGGHGMVVHRTAVQEVPFTIAPHHRNWDVLHSQMLTSRGYELVELPDCVIEDVEGGEPWL